MNATPQQGAVRCTLEEAPFLMCGLSRNLQVPPCSVPSTPGACGGEGLLSAHLGDLGNQAPEAEQSLRHSRGTGAHLLVHVLVGDKGSDHTDPAGVGEREGGCWLDAHGASGLGPRLPPDLGAPHSSTRVVSSRKVMRTPRSQAIVLCSIFTRPPQRRRQRKQQKQSPAVGIASR